MKLTEKKAILIAQEYKNQFPKLKNKIIRAQFMSQFDVTGGKGWIVTGEYEQFGEIWDFFYVISEETELVEYTFNHHGTRNPHLK